MARPRRTLRDDSELQHEFRSLPDPAVEPIEPTPQWSDLDDAADDDEPPPIDETWLDRLDPTDDEETEPAYGDFWIEPDDWDAA